MTLSFKFVQSHDKTIWENDQNTTVEIVVVVSSYAVKKVLS